MSFTQRFQWQGQNWKAELLIPNPVHQSVSLDISFPPSFLIVWGLFYPLKTSTCLVTSPQDPWISRQSACQCGWRTLSIPCHLISVPNCSLLDSSPVSPQPQCPFLVPTTNPGCIAVVELSCPPLSPSPTGQINQELSPYWLSLGPVHLCDKGPIQEGWSLQLGHASRRES